MNDQWKADLIRLIQECRAMNQDQRFGQLVYNEVMKANPKWAQDDFHQLLFYIPDEKLVEIIKGIDKEAITE